MTETSPTTTDTKGLPEKLESLKEAAAKYLPESKEELAVFIRELKECIRIRAAEGINPSAYLDLIKGIIEHLSAYIGINFVSDYQKIEITDTITFYSFQLPGGGNLNIFDTPEGKLVLDTGYGCFFEDSRKMAENLGLGNLSDVKKVICTHADADHCGAAGYFEAPPLMHPVTKAILDAGTRGYGSPNGKEILEKVYTIVINTISGLKMPDSVILTGTEPLAHRGLFPVIGYVTFSGMNFEIWESLGGHIAGQLLLFEPDLGILFTSDAFINFKTLSKERSSYCSIADSMIGSVNVNSETARTERQELVRLAAEFEKELREKGKELLICCGHGAVCRLEGGNLVPAGEILRYRASDFRDKKEQ